MPPPVKYPVVCPTCGSPLTAIASTDPNTAPWGCYVCGRGYFVAELVTAFDDPEAWGGNAGWLSGTTAIGVAAACEGEVVEAIDRGTSLRPEMITFVDDGTLAMISKRRNTSAAMKQAINAHRNPPKKKTRARKKP